jgi:hypothetical protein
MDDESFLQTLTILVGHRLAGADALAAGVRVARDDFANAGVVVGPGPLTNGNVDVAALTTTWRDWLAESTPASGAHGLLPEPSLLDPLLIHDEAHQLVSAVSAVPTVRAIAFVRTPEDHVAASYLDQLTQGRKGPYGPQERRGLGRYYNYFGRLDKWAAAVGPQQLVVRLCPRSADLSLLGEVLDEVMGTDGVGLAQHLTGRTDLPLSASAAEALRRFNNAVELMVPRVPAVNRVRADAVSLLTEWSRGEPPFALPPEGALSLRARFDGLIRDLAAGLPEPEAAAYVDPGEPPHQPHQPDDVARLIDQLSTRLELPGLPDAVKAATRPEQERAEQRARLRGLAARATASDRPNQYQRILKRMRSVMEETVDFRLRTWAEAGGAARSIPSRVVQYWEPLPPPVEMEPWLSSWSRTGMPGGEYLLLTFDTGIEIMREAAGDIGVRAFETAPHPAARADLVRYAELYLRGGWYVDAEHEALLPINDALAWPVAHLMVRRPGGGDFQNGFIGAIPGSPMLHEALTRGCANVLGDKKMTILQMTGPTMYTAVVKEYMARPDACFVVLPTNVVFAGVLHKVHNDADYKLRGHWRDQIITKTD